MKPDLPQTEDSVSPDPITKPRRKPVRKKATTRLRKSAPWKKAAPPSVLSDDDIRLRAYFISEQRIRFSLPGNADSDWSEAHRQLLAERNGGN